MLSWGECKISEQKDDSRASGRTSWTFYTNGQWEHHLTITGYLEDFFQGEDFWRKKKHTGDFVFVSGRHKTWVSWIQNVIVCLLLNGRKSLKSDLNLLWSWGNTSGWTPVEFKKCSLPFSSLSLNWVMGNIMASASWVDKTAWQELSWEDKQIQTWTRRRFETHRRSGRWQRTPRADDLWGVRALPHLIDDVCKLLQRGAHHLIVAPQRKTLQGKSTEEINQLRWCSCDGSTRTQ